MKLVLCGYMGSGKTLVGKQLARLLTVDFMDLDEQMETFENNSVSAIFKEKGELYFRKLENRVLKQLMSSPKKIVIALGGGTPCYGNNLKLIKSANACLIYLKADIDTLTERLFAERANRPLLAHLDEKKALEDFIRKHLFERGFFYQQAEVVVEIAGKSAPVIAKEIRDKLN